MTADGRKIFVRGGNSEPKSNIGQMLNRIAGDEFYS
jgi:hypothetical protein